MLSKQYRLKKKSDIEQVFKKGESLKGSLLICKYIPNQLKFNRACFTIAKKIKLNSPERNRIKRQLREAYKTILKSNQLESNQHYDFVFILYKIPYVNRSNFLQFQENFQYIITKTADV
jgi:ribonuclease P protein component